MKKNLLVFFITILYCLSIVAQNKNGFGAILIGNKKFSSLAHYKLAEEYRITSFPDSFFINTPPVKDQGRMSSCVGWAVGYILHSTFKYGGVSTQWNDSNEGSPAYVYNFLKWFGDRNCNTGLPIIYALNLLRFKGVCSIKSMPYVDGICTPLPNGDQIAEGEQRVIPLRWLAVDPKDVDLMKNILLGGRTPIVVGFKVTDAFETMWYHGRGMWVENSGNILGKHSVCIIGFDEKRKMFKAQNSWGAENGDNGFFWVTYDLVRKGCFDEAYTLPNY